MLSMGCKWKTRRVFLKSFTFNCSMLWNATCPDTFAQSHRSLAVHSAGRDCSQSWGPQESEVCRFAQLSYFSRVAIETTRVFGIHTLSFVKSLGKRLSWHFGDPKSTSFLIQRLSIAVQRGNAISIHSTFASAIDFLLLILLHLHLSVLLFLVPQRVTNSHNSFSLYNLTLCSHTLHFVMLCSHNIFTSFNASTITKALKNSCRFIALPYEFTMV